ncbi:sulfur transferase domain-containing protein [Enterovirga sp.]|uniref:fused DSP-PTPase phosphatase/NAD kinase-like protein n=1 Tax=Enterovirga sp. TaxID=2026350 RepID=UPI002618AD02|nr:sulfur transferase domain-containing protein [Enterovirga sp.]
MLTRFLKPETRYARRMARIARWDRELAGPIDRAHAWANMLFVDHGVFRVLYPNLGRVSEELWRSSQPSPGQIARLARAGLRTIVNVRGGREHGSWPLEREACERHGVALVDVVLRSREPPSPEAIGRVAVTVQQIAYPALVHCKSGADRAGLFAALYLILRKGATVAEARSQLALRFGHFRHAKTGILDAFLDAYEAGGEAKGLSLEAWISDGYDPEALARGFKPTLWSTLIADRLLRRE